MFLATLDTANYRFTALGTTEQEARGVLGAAWQHHAEQMGAVWSVDDIAGDVNVQELRPGTANRDGSHLVTADTWTSASRQTFIDTGAYLVADDEPHPFDLPSPAADLLARFRADQAEVRALFAAAGGTGPVQDNAYARAYEADDTLAEEYLDALADALEQAIRP